MFDISGISGFMSGVTGLGWAPNIPVPNYGDYQNVNTLFQTTLGPQGLQGMPGAPASISASFSGYAAGGSTSYNIDGSSPVYGTVYNQVPVYSYNTKFINPLGFGPQLVMQTNNGDAKSSSGAEEELQGTDVNGNKTQYTEDWATMAKAADANGDGLLTDDELNKVQLWCDKHNDGTVHSEDLKSLKDLNVQKVNLQNGAVMTKDLQGYQNVASQQVVGYYNANIYANSGGSNVGFNYTPVQPTQSTQEIIAGMGSYSGLSGYGGNGGYGTYGYNYPSCTGAYAFAGGGYAQQQSYAPSWSNQWASFGFAGAYFG